MKLYLVQHGEAKSKDEDPERPLTEGGRRDVAKVADFLRPLRLTVTAAWQSGKTRAAETADVLARALELKEGVTERADIAPGDPVGPVGREIAGAGEDIMIVGHLPFLAKLASLLVAGAESADVVSFRNGGVVCLERGGGDRWSVLWAVTPDVLP